MAYLVEERKLIVTASVQVEAVGDKMNKPSVLLVETFQKHDCNIAQ